MDGSRFDLIAKALSGALHRRGFARGLMGGVAALAGGGALTDATAEAGNRQPIKCNKMHKACGKTCVNPRTDPRHCGRCRKRCGPGMECSAGRCTEPQPNGT